MSDAGTAAPGLFAKIASSAAYGIVGGLLGRAVGLVGTLLVARHLTPDIVAEVTVATVVALTGLRVAALAAGYAWTFVKAPVLHVMGFIARWRAGGSVAALGRFAGAAARAGGVLRTVGTIAAAIGGGPLTSTAMRAPSVSPSGRISTVTP